jgi:putative endonuclease
VVARNWKCALGEIDLILMKGGVLVICEVKARRGRGWGGPHEAVTWKKKRKLRMLAQAYLDGFGRTASTIRFDVASVTVDAVGRPSVFVFEDAF